MEQIKSILEGLFPNIDFSKEKHLMTDGILDSISVVSIIAELEDAFDISVPMEYIQPSWFESAETIAEMVEELH